MVVKLINEDKYKKYKSSLQIMKIFGEKYDK